MATGCGSSAMAIGAADHPRRLRLEQAIFWIVEAARRLRQNQVVIDGEAVILESTAPRTSMPCADRHNDEVQLAEGGADLEQRA